MSPCLCQMLLTRTFVQNVFHIMKGRRGEREKKARYKESYRATNDSTCASANHQDKTLAK